MYRPYKKTFTTNWKTWVISEGKSWTLVRVEVENVCVRYEHDVESFRVGGAGDRGQRWYGLCTVEWERRGVEPDPREGGCGSGPLQLLGVEHRRRSTDGAHYKWEYSDHSRSYPQPPVIITGLQPVRSKSGNFRPDGGAHVAVSPRLLFGRWFWQDQVVLFDEVHSYNPGMLGVDLQHHRHSSRQVRLQCITIFNEKSSNQRI